MGERAIDSFEIFFDLLTDLDIIRNIEELLWGEDCAWCSRLFKGIPRVLDFDKRNRSPLIVNSLQLIDFEEGVSDGCEIGSRLYSLTEFLPKTGTCILLEQVNNFEEF
jgi:hypothetical protein